MTASVREQILQALAVTMGTISIANGYDNNYPGGVQRFTQEPGTLEQLPVIGVVFLSESKDKQEPMYACSLFVDISIYAYDAVNDSELTDTQLDSYQTDVERALEVDESLGGLARDLMITGSDPMPVSDGMAFVGRTVKVQIEYMHRIVDPRVKG